MDDADIVRRITELADHLGEFVLPYGAVGTAHDPDAMLLAFFQSAYEVAAELVGWDRAGLEVTP